jgi:hypothetical protein
MGKLPNSALLIVKARVLSKASELKAVQRLVALAVADRMKRGDGGRFGCWCSARDIAARTGLGARSVRAALQTLCSADETDGALFTRKRRRTERGLGCYAFELVQSPHAYVVAVKDGAARRAAPNIAAGNEERHEMPQGAAADSGPDRHDVPRRTFSVEPIPRTYPPNPPRRGGDDPDLARLLDHAERVGLAINRQHRRSLREQLRGGVPVDVLLRGIEKLADMPDSVRLAGRL